MSQNSIIRVALEAKNLQPPHRPAEDRTLTLHFYYGLDQQKACQRAASEKSGVSHLKRREARISQIKP